MTKFQQDIVNLIMDGLQNKGGNYTGLDYAGIFDFAKNQQLVGLLFYGLSFQDDFKDNEIYSKFLNTFMNTFKLSELQLVEFKKICDKFNEENITYLPLKGSVLKSIYPHPEMRTMGDMDIFIDLNALEKVNKIMLGLGYIFVKESDHELIWQKDKISIELHKRLIPSYNKDFYEYYGDGWGFIKDNRMSEEDTFIYIFTHFAKHYRDKGVGIKYVVDFYVYLSTYKNLDFNYIESEFKKLRLYEFYLNIRDVIDVWFNDKDETEKINFITDFLFTVGVYGKQENAPLSEGLKISKSTNSLKSTKFLRLIFPTYETMSYKYPILNKIKILLPFFYIVRWFEILFKRTREILPRIKNLNHYNQREVEEYKKNLNYVGLDYNFDNKNIE